MLSTVANNCFLPFRASLFMTSLMSGTIIAQNTCLQMCVIGRDSFVGAGNNFTDFNLIGESDGRGGVVPRTIKASNIRGELEDVGQVVLGGAVGHNCRIGSGMIIFPGRMIESDVTLFASAQRRVITRDVRYEESDHFIRPKLPRNWCNASIHDRMSATSVLVSIHGNGGKRYFFKNDVEAVEQRRPLRAVRSAFS